MGLSVYESLESNGFVILNEIVNLNLHHWKECEGNEEGRRKSHKLSNDV